MQCDKHDDCLGPIVARGLPRTGAYARANAERAEGHKATVTRVSRGRYIVRAWED